MRSFVPSLVILLMMVTTLPALAAGPEEARIAQTRAELQAVRAELGEAQAEADTEMVALEDADRQLQAAFDAVEAADQAVSRQQSAVDDAESRLVQARADLADQRQLMGERISRLYRQVRPDPVLQVLGARTVTQAVQQGAYMSAIGREDRSVVETLGNATRTVAAEEQALAAEQVTMGRVLVEQQALLDEVEEIRNDQAVIAAASQDLVARLSARETHLEDQAAELERVIREREAAAARAAAAAEAAAVAARQPTAQSPAQSSGSASGDVAQAAAPAPPPPSGGGFSWPTQGTVTSEFGPRWGRMHEGLDIANGTGTPVSASKGGSVIHAGPLSGYGNLVLVSHGGGFVTAYAHLSSIAVSEGQSVSTGTFLGGMGCSGSCTGTHLHFEIRANGAPVNPRNYL